ncbi:unnamed protein product [Rhizophagus irregularis]|nr:unnamed protein product [Rhizophagus irregularis]
METYNKYFSKRPGNADKEFYLREYVAEDDYIIYNHWFQKFHVEVLEPFLHFSTPDKQALTPIELQSTFTNAREIFKAKINQEKPNSIF